jgi:hypothetical protein
MKTEKRNNKYNNPVSLKTSLAVVYCINITNNISRLVMAGFFMHIPVRDLEFTKCG